MGPDWRERSLNDSADGIEYLSSPQRCVFCLDVMRYAAEPYMMLNIAPYEE